MLAFLARLEVGHHLPDAALVRGVDERALAQAPLPLGRLLGEDVLLLAVRPRDLSGSRPLEPLGGPAVGLHLRHPSLRSRAPAARRSAPRRRPPPAPSSPPSGPPRRPRGWARGSSRGSDP